MENFENKVFIGDARDMSPLPTGSVDLIVTSPPYFSVKNYARDGKQEQMIGVKKRGQIGDLKAFDTFISELLLVWHECCRVLKPNGKLVINSPLMPMLKKEFATHENRQMFDINAAIQSSILQNINSIHLLDTYVWNRTNPSKKLMFGSYPYPTNFYAQNTIEFVTVYVKGGPSRKVSAAIKKASKISQAEWVEMTRQVWNIPVPNKSDLAYGIHSALMPEEIVRRAVKLYSFAGDLVLDPFTGSGTTLKVAKELGRKFVGFEIMESYADVINKKVGAQVCLLKEVPRRESEFPLHLINKVFSGDALEFMREIPDNSVPLVCVDPPYNLGKGDWDSWRTEAEYFGFMRSWLVEAIRVLKPGGSLFTFNTPRNSARILSVAEQLGMHFQNWITWDKRDGFTSTKKRFVPGQETILFLSKGSNSPYFDAESIRIPYESTERIEAAKVKGILKNGKRWFPNKNGRLVGDVWHIVSERHSTKQKGKIAPTLHPTQKPVELVRRIILAASRPGDIVVDCFLGTGTTAVAALETGRRFAGAEINAVYCAIAEKRIKNIGSNE